jgi:hypothetical protein
VYLGVGQRGYSNRALHIWQSNAVETLVKARNTGLA